MAETWFMRGEGGSIIKMDRPFPEGIQQRVDAGLIVRVNEDGSSWTDDDSDDSENASGSGDTDAADGSDESDDAGTGDGGDGDTTDTPPSPANHAPKSEWIDYAVQVGGMTRDDASALTKAELIDRFDNR